MDGDAGVHGLVMAATGWALRIVDDPATSQPPTDEELHLLRDLRARTSRA